MVGKNMLKLVASNPVLIFSKKNEKMCYGGGGYGESSYVQPGLSYLNGFAANLSM